MPSGPTIVPAGKIPIANHRAEIPQTTAAYDAEPVTANRAVFAAAPDRPRVLEARLSAAPSESGRWPADWSPRTTLRPWKYIVFHHSATTDGDVQSIDAEHRVRTDSSGEPWLGIGYHFVIGNGGAMTDGEVAATFRWRDQLQGAHAGSHSYNEDGIGICFIGDFEKGPPTPRQIASARELVATLTDRCGIARSNCIRHSDVQKTACPGQHFPLTSMFEP